ncbi:alpha/beta fold hydrolase [Catenulispora yoronensis]
MAYPPRLPLQEDLSTTPPAKPKEGRTTHAQHPQPRRPPPLRHHSPSRPLRHHSPSPPLHQQPRRPPPLHRPPPPPPLHQRPTSRPTSQPPPPPPPPPLPPGNRNSSPHHHHPRHTPSPTPHPLPTTAYAPKPTIVLVHGPFTDSTIWLPVIRLLRELGYPVTSAPNHLRGLAYDAAAVRSILDAIAGPIVLVGHSYGGAVISNAATGAPDIKALVYIAAFLPDEGESFGAILNENPGSLLGPDTTWTVPLPTQDTDIYIAEEHFSSVFAADIDTNQATDLATTQRPLSTTARDAASGPPAWRNVPAWALITLADNTIPPSAQITMAKRAGASIETVPASHAVAIADPQAVVKIILDAARH